MKLEECTKHGIYIFEITQEITDTIGFAGTIGYVIVLSTDEYSYDRGYGVQVAFSYFSTNICIRNFSPSINDQVIYSQWRII